MLKRTIVSVKILLYRRDCDARIGVSVFTWNIRSYYHNIGSIRVKTHFCQIDIQCVSYSIVVFAGYIICSITGGGELLHSFLLQGLGIAGAAGPGGGSAVFALDAGFKGFVVIFVQDLLNGRCGSRLAGCFGRSKGNKHGKNQNQGNPFLHNDTSSILEIWFCVKNECVCAVDKLSRSW